MKIHWHGAPQYNMSLEDFCRKEKLTLRGGQSYSEYWAKIDGLYEQEGGAVLHSFCARGKTPLMAVDRLCERLAGNDFIYRTGSDHRIIRFPVSLDPPHCLEFEPCDLHIEKVHA